MEKFNNFIKFKDEYGEIESDEAEGMYDQFVDFKQKTGRNSVKEFKTFLKFKSLEKEEKKKIEDGKEIKKRTEESQNSNTRKEREEREKSFGTQGSWRTPKRDKQDNKRHHETPSSRKHRRDDYSSKYGNGKHSKPERRRSPLFSNSTKRNRSRSPLQRKEREGADKEKEVEKLRKEIEESKRKYEAEVNKRKKREEEDQKKQKEEEKKIKARKETEKQEKKAMLKKLRKQKEEYAKLLKEKEESERRNKEAEMAFRKEREKVSDLQEIFLGDRKEEESNQHENQENPLTLQDSEKGDTPTESNTKITPKKSTNQNKKRTNKKKRQIQSNSDSESDPGTNAIKTFISDRNKGRATKSKPKAQSTPKKLDNLTSTSSSADSDDSHMDPNYTPGSDATEIDEEEGEHEGELKHEEPKEPDMYDDIIDKLNDSLQLDYTESSDEEEERIDSQIYPTQAAMKNLVEDMEEQNEEEEEETEEGSLSIRFQNCCQETRKEEDKSVVYKCSQCFDVGNIYPGKEAKKGCGMREVQRDKRYINHILQHHPDLLANKIFRVDLIKKEKRIITYDKPRETWWVGDEKEDIMMEEKPPTRTEQTIKRYSTRKVICYPAEHLQVTDDKAHWICNECGCGFEAVAKVTTEKERKDYNYKIKHHIMTRHYKHAGVDLYAPFLSQGNKIIFKHYQGVTDRRESWKVIPKGKIPAECEGEIEETFVEALQLNVTKSDTDRLKCGLCCRSLEDKGRGLYTVHKHIRQQHNTGPDVVYDVTFGQRIYLAHTVDMEGTRFAMMPWSRCAEEEAPRQE